MSPPPAAAAAENDADRSPPLPVDGTIDAFALSEPLPLPLPLLLPPLPPVSSLSIAEARELGRRASIAIDVDGVLGVAACAPPVAVVVDSVRPAAVAEGVFGDGADVVVVA